MAKIYSYRPDLHLASIVTDEKEHHLAVHVLQQNPGQKQPEITAYLGARYSRSADSISDIAAEAYAGGVDAAERLEKIFTNYGHKSVGDMADLFICIENLPMILAMKMFNQIPVFAAQERSTRYQNFSKPDYMKLPYDLDIPEKLRNDYDAIIAKEFRDYRELMEPSKEALAKVFKIDPKDKTLCKVLEARTFDTVRYLIPLGTCSSLGVLASARVWSDTIAYFAASPASMDRNVAALLYELLKGPEELTKLGYVPEAEGLVRHSDANYTTYESTAAVLELLHKWGIKTVKRELSEVPAETLKVEENVSAIKSLLRNYLLLEDSLSKESEVKLTAKQWEELGNVILKKHNQHNQIRNLGQQGAIAIEGMADHGILKDLNRHRSMERVVPLWNDAVNIEREFERANKNMYFLCDYLRLPGMEDMKLEFQTRLNATYTLIKKWLKDSAGKMPENIRAEYVKYLLPTAHATAYRFYCSVDDLQYTVNLRTRNGGHIAYRVLTAAWVKALIKKDPFWKGISEKMPNVSVESREQFIDRS